MSSIQLDFLSASEYFKLKRIEGHDLYIVSCGRSFAILKCQQYRLVLIMKYLQITVQDIVDFEFKDRTLWLKESGSNKLFTVTFEGDSGAGQDEKPTSPSRVRNISEDLPLPLNELGDYLVKNAPKIGHLPLEANFTKNSSKIQAMREEPISESSLKGSMVNSQAFSLQRDQIHLQNQGSETQLPTTLSNPKNGEITHGQLGVRKITVAYDLGRIYIAGLNGVSIF